MIFFINIGPTLSKKIKPDLKASYKIFLKNKTNHVFNFQTIDRSIVLKIINDLPNKASCGFDNLSFKLMQSIKFNILDSLTLIINQKGDPTITDNYRPISLLPTLSKVFKKHVLINYSHISLIRNFFIKANAVLGMVTLQNCLQQS